MSESVIGTSVLEPYAEALMSLAQAQDLVDRFGEDTRGLSSLLAESAELSQFLSSPLVGDDAKKAVLRQVVSDQVHPYMLNFLMLLVDRRRIAFLDGICQRYQVRLRKLKKTVLAEVTSAIALTEAQIAVVREKIIAMTGASEVELQLAIDPDLIGGVVIQIGSQIIDASLQGQLRRIGMSLSSR